MSVFQHYQPTLDMIDQQLFDFLKSGDRYLNGSLDYLQTMRGKQLRPLLCLIGADILATEPNLAIATALEMLHVGSLMHDDVIDESKLRRGKASIQSKYSKEYAIYMGDYLFSSLFVLLADTPIKTEVLVGLAKLMQKICVAEMTQWHHRHNLNQSRREYLKIISGKTAALFSVALGSAGDESALQKRLHKIGYHLGMAFQIQDDLLDFSGDEAVVGKELRKDLALGQYSLPILYALEIDHARTGALLEAEGELSDDVKAWVIESGALANTQSLLELYYAKITEQMQRLPQGRATDHLQELIDFMRLRVY